MKKLGLDIGSTTLKCVLLEDEKIIYSSYTRHYLKILQTVVDQINEISSKFADEEIEITVSGSAGMGIAEQLGLPFVQEVYAEQLCVKRRNPATDVVIELGGEDAKILFLTGGFEMRMNGTCAGGTGAFIDQMASLMKLSPDEMNQLAQEHKRVYTVASRCGVFAKSDIQQLINQGATKEDICSSIFYAVVNQAIAGLAQGREIKGNVLYLGGPLTFMSELRHSFDKAMKVNGSCPDHSLFYVAIGSTYSKIGKSMMLSEIKDLFDNAKPTGHFISGRRLFSDRKEYEDFLSEHQKASEGTELIR